MADSTEDTEKTVLHPEVTVKLVGEDGNAFAILGRVRAALKEAGCTPKEVQEFTDEATNGDYSHLLQTVCRWVSVDADEEEEEFPETTSEDLGVDEISDEELDEYADDIDEEDDDEDSDED